jgi:hypothetical protein
MVEQLTDVLRCHFDLHTLDAGHKLLFGQNATILGRVKDVEELL